MWYVWVPRITAPSWPLLVPQSLMQWLGALSQVWLGRLLKGRLALVTQQSHRHSDSESQTAHGVT